VPGYTWAPSWVVWRNDDNNIGWFPMPPGNYDGEGEYPDMYADWYGYRDWYPGFDETAFVGLWSFVAASDLLAANVDGVVFAPDRVRGFIGRTRNWTHYAVERGHVVDRAFDSHRFAATFHRPLPVSGHFHGRGPMATVAAGRTAAEHERNHPTNLATSRISHSGGRASLGHTGGVGSAGRFGPGGSARGGYGHSTYGHSTAFGRSGGYGHSSLGHSAGFGRSSGYGHSAAYGSATGSSHSGGFGRSGNGMGHTSPSSEGFRHSGGIARSGAGGSAFSRGQSSGFGRAGGEGSGGFGRSTGSGGFGHSSGNALGGGGFGHSNGGLGNVQHASTPHFSSGGSQGGGKHHK
jgi:hypothetical protein